MKGLIIVAVIALAVLVFRKLKDKPNPGPAPVQDIPVTIDPLHPTDFNVGGASRLLIGVSAANLWRNHIGYRAYIDDCVGRLKAKHLKMIPEGFTESEGKNINPAEVLPIIAAVSGLDEDTVGELDMADLISISEALEDFLLKGTALSRKTGKKRTGR